MHTQSIRRCESQVENKVITIYNVVGIVFVRCANMLIVLHKWCKRRKNVSANEWVSRFFRLHQQKVLFDLWLWFSVSRVLRFVYGNNNNKYQTPSTPSTPIECLKRILQLTSIQKIWRRLRFVTKITVWHVGVFAFHRTHVLLSICTFCLITLAAFTIIFAFSSRVILQSDILIWFRTKIIIDFQ